MPIFPSKSATQYFKGFLLFFIFVSVGFKPYSQSVDTDLDSLINVVLTTSSTQVSTANLLGNKPEHLTFKKLISDSKLTTSELLPLVAYIHKSKKFSTGDLTRIINGFVSKPTTNNYVDLSYIKIKWYEVSGYRDNNELIEANKIHKSMTGYLNSIKIEDANFKRAEIYTSEYDIILKLIRGELDEGVELCTKNEQKARSINDTSLIIQSVYNRCEFYTLKRRLDLFIEESEYCLKLDSARGLKSEFYISNLMHLADAYIYKGEFPERSLEILNLIHREENYKIDSYAYYAKFLASADPEGKFVMDIFELVESDNMLDFFSKTKELSKNNLYPTDYYQFLRESAYALTNFGHTNEGLRAMENANAVIREIYTSDLTEALATHEKNMAEQEEKLDLKYAEKLSNYYLLALILGSILLLGILILLFRKTRQNWRLAQKNERIKQQDEEKALLMKELHHRVKNNFQITSSLLLLESKNNEDPKMKTILTEIQSRISSMALTHEKLYGNSNFEYKLDDYIESLYLDLINIFSFKDSNLHLEINSELIIDIEMAIPFGLIFNELITNSLKHFSKTEEAQVISITVVDQKDFILVSYSDSGEGISKELNFDSTKSMGLSLVKRLTRQLQGEVKYENETFLFKFPTI
jgi:two-component sensor histidine kinase